MLVFVGHGAHGSAKTGFQPHSAEKETSMFQELAPEQFARFRPLFEGFDYSLSLQAAIEGLSPRRMFAERTENPDYYDHLAALAWGHLGNAEKALPTSMQRSISAGGTSSGPGNSPGSACCMACPNGHAS
jgi:hypothetical protein